MSHTKCKDCGAFPCHDCALRQCDALRARLQMVERHADAMMQRLLEAGAVLYMEYGSDCKCFATANDYRAECRKG